MILYQHYLDYNGRNLSSGVSKVTVKQNEKWFNEFRYDMYKHSLFGKWGKLWAFLKQLQMCENVYLKDLCWENTTHYNW